MEREDTLPWYKQFWPWFIIALPASAVVAGLFTVWLSMQTSDSLVVRSSVGINITTETIQAADAEADRMGLSANIEIDAKTGSVHVTLFSKTGDPATSDLKLEVIHPTLADRDMHVALAPAMPDVSGNPTWAGHFVDLPRGRHYLVLSSGVTWRLSGEWVGQTSTTLGVPANGGL